MIQAVSAPVIPIRQRYPGGDAAIAGLLGLALLGAGWLDAKSFLLHRRKPVPAFDFLDPQGSQRVVLDELYRSPDTFALLENIGAVEMNLPKHYRYAFGPASTIRLTTFHSRARLNIEFYNDIPDQDITVRCKRCRARPLPPPAQGNLRAQLPADPTAGHHRHFLRLYPLQPRPPWTSASRTRARWWAGSFSSST